MKKALLSVAAICCLLSANPVAGCAGTAAAVHNDNETADTEISGPGRDSGSMSFIILGDMHYCEPRFYDLDAMLAEKAGDHRQITKTYAPVTEANWEDQIAQIRKAVRNTKPEVKCIVQLGDISEGLANYEGAADLMAENVTDVLRKTKMGVPWVLAKGNHDITGVGDFKQDARDAFNRHYVPFIKEQTGCTDVNEGNYVYRNGDCLFVALDSWNSKTDQVEFARTALEGSDARYKFVFMHEPVVPVSERCWFFLKKDDEKRNELLKVIAENKAIVLCGHLHRYSVLRRNTEWGPVVQVMAASVTNLKRKAAPGYELGLEQYGEYLVDWKPDFSPSNAEWRREVLRKEAQYVDWYKLADVAGYGVISIDGKKGKITLNYYSAFSDTAYDTVDLSGLLNGK